MFYRPQRPINRFRDWRWRRPLTLLLLVGLAVLTITGRDTFSKSGQPAQAGSCYTQTQQWGMQSGDVPLQYGRVTFGATVCLTNDGHIESVSPILSGGIEGIGTTAGFSWDNRGAWVQSNNGMTAVVMGSAKSKLCIARVLPFCSLTDTQTFTMRIMGHGAWVGPIPGIWAASRSCDMLGGCAPATRFIRLR